MALPILKPLTDKPIWLVGAGLAGLWLAVEVVSQALHEVGQWLPWGVAAVGAGLWLTQRRKLPVAAAPNPNQLDRAAAEQALRRSQQLLRTVAAEVPDWSSTAGQVKLDRWTADLERSRATVALLGGPAVGKSALLGALQRSATELANAIADYQELPSLFVGGEASNEASDPDTLDAALEAPWTLFVTAGDITETEYTALEWLLANGQQPIVAFNKADRYLPADRATVLTTIQHRLHGQLAAEAIVPVAAAPAPIKVRKHSADGHIQESVEQPEPDLAQLLARLQTQQAAEGDRWRWRTIVGNTGRLNQQLHQTLKIQRRDRAIALIDQSQWIAAATAFANPMPGLDLLATAAINGQLVMDLGQIYQQSFSLDRAQAIAQTLGEVMLKLGLVELGSQAIATALKTSALTYAAGGAIQGLSAAYLTRVAGLSLVELFQAHVEAEWEGVAEGDRWLSADRLSRILKGVFEQTRQSAIVQGLVEQARDRFLPSPAAS
ncbi:MAG: DUF697 domain-containing protein [Oscillatoriales cyanobacterium]|nr:MAG: DUF697 domain-containing protein [Oscillatoriales cyanobacterium]